MRCSPVHALGLSVMHQVLSWDCGAPRARPSSRPWQVKADKDSSNLSKLQQASRGVNQATAGVVASTKSGKSQIEEKGERGAVGLHPDLCPLCSWHLAGCSQAQGGFCLCCWEGGLSCRSGPQQ